LEEYFLTGCIPFRRKCSAVPYHDAIGVDNVGLAGRKLVNLWRLTCLRKD